MAIRWWMILAWVACALPGAGAAEPKLLKVEKLWDKGPHNAFTDLIRHDGRMYCCFREGDSHVGGEGKIRILASADGAAWEAVGLVAVKGEDLRDPHLSITPDGRLMLVGGAAVPARRDPLRDHYSFVSFSKDGRVWTAPQRVLNSWQWLWRVTWHRGRAYGVAYGWNPKTPGDPKNFRAAVYGSADGLKYEKLADVPLPNPTEASLAFDGDVAYCLQRRDGNPNSAQLGVSRAPFQEWAWKDLKVYFGGPSLTKGPDGTWWAVGRLIDKGKPNTTLCRLDVDKGALHPALTLPSGGDTSYPGLLWHDNALWISYYSSHEGRTSIYLARVQTRDDAAPSEKK